MSIDIKELISSTVKTDWKDILIDCLDDKIIELLEKINYEEKQLYPPKELMFECFNYFNFSDINVIILGQDPYYKPNLAHGLAFSVPYTQKIPPSLRNIYIEIKNEHFDIENINELEQFKHGNLINWAKQGVLLLNTALTVIENKPNSHKTIWKQYTDNIIKKISEDNEKCVFFLWGNNAKSKKPLIDHTKHFIIECCHPSPLSAGRGWFFSNQFSSCNFYLKKNNKNAINWF